MVKLIDNESNHCSPNAAFRFFLWKTRRQTVAVFVMSFVYTSFYPHLNHLRNCQDWLSVTSYIISTSKVSCLFARNNSSSLFTVFKTMAGRNGRATSLRGRRKNYQRLFQLKWTCGGKMWSNDCKTVTLVNLISDQCYQSQPASIMSFV